MNTLSHAFLLVSCLSLFLSRGPTETLAGPLSVDGFWIRLVFIAVGYIVTLAFSGPVTRFFILFPSAPAKEPDTQEDSRRAKWRQFNVGTIIDKCENILALTLILAGEAGSLAIIFAAKSLVRSEDIRRNPKYFLAARGELYLVGGGWVSPALVGQLTVTHPAAARYPSAGGDYPPRPGTPTLRIAQPGSGLWS